MIPAQLVPTTPISVISISLNGLSVFALLVSRSSAINEKIKRKNPNVVMYARYIAVLFELAVCCMRDCTVVLAGTMGTISGVAGELDGRFAIQRASVNLILSVLAASVIAAISSCGLALALDKIDMLRKFTTLSSSAPLRSPARVGARGCSAVCTAFVWSGF